MNLSQYQFDSHPFTIVQYKNCTFHGQLYGSVKQNVGIMLLDTGEIIIANFVNDQLNGDALIFLNTQTYVIGSFTRGMLDGKFLLRNKLISIYWTVRMNKIQGQIIVINYQTLNTRIWIIQNGQGHCLQQIDIKQNDKESDILSVISMSFKPYASALEFLYEKFSKSLLFQPQSVNQTVKVSLQTNSNQRVSFTLFKEKIVQYGVYYQNSLNGMGYTQQGLNILQGRFKNGKLDGCGIKWQLETNKIIYGTFKNGDIRSLDILSDNEQQARKQLKKYKKLQHIYSLQYCNNYFNERPILMLANFFNTIQQNDKKFTQQLQAQQNITIKSKNQSKQSILEKEQSRFSPVQKANLNLFLKQRSSDKVLISEAKTQNYPSRFQRVNKNLGFTEDKMDFNEGINEINRINKALRKFK